MLDPAAHKVDSAPEDDSVHWCLDLREFFINLRSEIFHDFFVSIHTHGPFCVDVRVLKTPVQLVCVRHPFILIKVQPRTNFLKLCIKFFAQCFRAICTKAIYNYKSLSNSTKGLHTLAKILFFIFCKYYDC